MKQFDMEIIKFYTQHKNIPFVWGKSDCSVFANDWVKQWTGKDIRADFEDYQDENGAIEVLTKNNYQDQHQLLDRYFHRSHKNRLRRGDLVGHYFENSAIMAIGICAGRTCLFQGDEGIIKVPIIEIKPLLCWRVD